jgi:tetratricopeptide (TPR) repeat protein
MCVRLAARRLIVAGFLISSPVTTAWALQTGRPPADPYYEFLTARRLESQGDPKGALAALERAAAADPDSAEIRAEIAALHMRQDRLTEAEQAAKAALALDDKSIDAHRVLGLIYSAHAEEAAESGQSSRAPQLSRNAIAHLERVLATPSASTDVTIQYNLGRLYLRTGSVDKAIQSLTRVVEMQPYSVQARIALAQAQGAANEHDAAVETLRGAVEANPSSRELKLRLASALLATPQRENGQQAVEVLSPLLEQNAKDTRALYLRSQAHRRAGDVAAAERDARALLAVDPRNVSGTYALAQIYGQARRHRDVIQLLEPVVSSSAGRGQEIVPLMTSLSFAYQSVGELQKAIEVLAQAAKLAPDDSTTAAYLVQAHLDAKRYAEAAVLAAEAQNRYPNDLRFTRLHTRALFHTGAASRAIAIMEAALKAQPDDVSTHLAMAGLYADAGRVEEGVKTLDRAATRFPNDSSVPFQMGAILEKAGRHAEAERAFRRVLEMEPDHADALNYLGYMLADRGERLEEAIRLVSRALDLDGDNPSYLDSLGWAYFKRGDLARAEQQLSRAAEALPRNSVVQDHLGDLYSRMGRHREAIDAWNRALSGDGEDIDRATVEKKIRDARAKAR